MAADAAGLEGRWITFDGDTKAKRSVVEITRQGSGYSGRIVELFLQPGEPPDPVCDECPGEDRGRKMRGLAILALEREPDGPAFRGTVLDPEEGRVYRCVVTLESMGRRLALRGYVVLPIFGRSETWERAP